LSYGDGQPKLYTKTYSRYYLEPDLLSLFLPRINPMRSGLNQT